MGSCPSSRSLKLQILVLGNSTASFDRIKHFHLKCCSWQETASYSCKPEAYNVVVVPSQPKLHVFCLLSIQQVLYQSIKFSFICPFQHCLQNFSCICMLYLHFLVFCLNFTCCLVHRGHSNWHAGAVNLMCFMLVDKDNRPRVSWKGWHTGMICNPQSRSCIPQFIVASDKEWQEINCFPGCCFQMSHKWRAKRKQVHTT